MTTYAWQTEGGSAISAGNHATALRSLFGVDIWLDVRQGNAADREVTPAGDWKLADGEEVVRQSLLRRLVTNPGDWKTKPAYGVGAREFLKRKNTRANADELINRIRSQFVLDSRVEDVLAVTVDHSEDTLRIAVSVRLRGRTLRDRPMAVVLQVR